MNIVDNLKSKYREGVPIFDYEIFEMGYTQDDINESLKLGSFEEFETDVVPVKVYCLVNYSFCTELSIDLCIKCSEYDVILKYYMGNNFEYGYLDGFCALNYLGLSNQVCFQITIASSRITYEVKLDNIRVIPSDVSSNFLLYSCICSFKKYKKIF